MSSLIKNLLVCSVISTYAFYISLSNAAEINADSSIKAVTIYPGSAKITRLSTLGMVPGSNDIVIQGLPINLNQSSLRVTGESEADVSLGSIELQRTIQQDIIQEKEKNWVRKLNAYKRNVE